LIETVEGAERPVTLGMITPGIGSHPSRPDQSLGKYFFDPLSRTQ
jgi:hypothetical protein